MKSLFFLAVLLPSTALGATAVPDRFGYAVVEDGKINAETVSNSIRGAQALGLEVIGGSDVSPTDTDARVNRRFNQFGENWRVVPVRISPVEPND